MNIPSSPAHRGLVTGGLAALALSGTLTLGGAKALGEPLGPVVSITDQAPAQPLPQFAMSSAAAAGKSVPISPGTQQLSVSITAVFTV